MLCLAGLAAAGRRLMRHRTPRWRRSSARWTAPPKNSTPPKPAWSGTNIRRSWTNTRSKKEKSISAAPATKSRWRPDITEPDQKYVLFNGSKVQVYQPKIDQVTAYSTGKNREEFESFLVLGFGGRGHDILKSFDVKYQGNETVNGIDADKLDLVPKSAGVRNNVAHIILWIDPARGISVQQQFFFGNSGDFRLAKYSGIKVNEKIPDSVFKLKTTGKTKFISPTGDLNKMDPTTPLELRSPST